jgi:hypothetical protein
MAAKCLRHYKHRSQIYRNDPIPGLAVNFFCRPANGCPGTVDENVYAFGLGDYALEKILYRLYIFEVERKAPDLLAGIGLNLLGGSFKLLFSAGDNCNIGSVFGQTFCQGKPDTSAAPCN